MAGSNRRPQRTRAKKEELLNLSRSMDDEPRRHAKERNDIAAQQAAEFKLPKRPPILPSDDLKTCIVKYMSDGDEYSIDEMQTLMLNVTPNIEAVPRIMMEMFKDGSLTDRKDTAEGSTTYYYTLNQGTNVNQQATPAVKKEPTPYNIDYALFSIMLDNKKHSAADLLQQVQDTTGFPRNLVDQRLSKLMFRSEIERMGKGKNTTYTLKKGIPMEKLVKEEPAPSPLANVSSQALAELGEKFTVKIPAIKKEPPVPEVNKYRKLSAEERSINKDDTIQAMIWKAMYDNGFFNIVEVALVLKEHGKSETAVRNVFNDLIGKEWFFMETRGKRNIRYFAVKANIDPFKTDEEVQLNINAVVEEPQDDRPNIWVTDLASKMNMDVASVVRMLPDHGLEATAKQMVTAKVADKLRASADPKKMLAGISMNDLAKDLDVPLSMLIVMQNRLNPGCSLTVESVERLRECEDIIASRGSITVIDLANELGLAPFTVINWLTESKDGTYAHESILSADEAVTVRLAYEQGELAVVARPVVLPPKTVPAVALKLRTTVANVIKWLKMNNHEISPANEIAGHVADLLEKNPQLLNTISGAIVVGDLALEIGVTPADIIGSAAKAGQMVTISQVLAQDLADLIRKDLVSTTTVMDLALELNQTLDELVSAHCDINARGRTSIQSDSVLNNREVARLREYFQKFKLDQKPDYLSYHGSANEQRARAEFAARNSESPAVTAVKEQVNDLRSKIGLAPHASAHATGQMPSVVPAIPKSVNEIAKRWHEEEPAPKRRVLKVHVEIFGIKMTIEQADKLGDRLKAMGLEDPARREALKSDELLGVKFCIGGEERTVDELYELYQQLDENGFTE